MYYFVILQIFIHTTWIFGYTHLLMTFKCGYNVLDINATTVTLNIQVTIKLVIIYLPLQIMFRPIAMMYPETKIIAEVCLKSYGFNSSHKLALTLVTLQTLCSEQFSNQGRFCYG